MFEISGHSILKCNDLCHLKTILMRNGGLLGLRTGLLDTVWNMITQKQHKRCLV